MIDWDRVVQLRDEVGTDEFDPVLDLIMDEIETALMRLSPGDAGKLERDLHFLKGSAWNLGLSDFAALCQTGEALAARGETARVSTEALLRSYAVSKQVFLRDLALVLAGDAGDEAEVA